VDGPEGDYSTLGNAQGGASDSEAEWTLRERQLREEEVASQRRSADSQRHSTRWHATTAIAAILAVIVAGGAAIFAAVKADDAIEVAKEGIQRQADESRLTAAMGGIGGDTPTQRIAGLTLLRRHATQRLESAIDGDQREGRETVRLYNGTLDILENYLKSAVPPRQLGEGNPPLPSDFFYAAGDLRELLRNKHEPGQPLAPAELFKELTNGDPRDRPSIDLSTTDLHGLSWATIDFEWLSSRFFSGVDLRHANLRESQWGVSTLQDAHLQCADFRDVDFEPPKAVWRRAVRQGNPDDAARANFMGARLHRARLERAHLRNAKLVDADLTGANLKGADLRHADFTGADLAGADLTGAKFKRRALDAADGEEEAYGVPGRPEPPPDFEDQRSAECGALLAG
jgi:uncharacterized protein YjbI with pentapeptide repeats